MMRTRLVPWSRLLSEDRDIKLANLVTLSRAALIVPIIVLLLWGFDTAALGLNLIAVATDCVDGWLARRSGRASAFGAQLDAAVDNLYSFGILAFLLLAYPGIGVRHGWALAVLFGGPLVYLGLSHALCGRFLMFHFRSAKFGAALLFCLWPLLALSGIEMLIPVAAAVVGLSRLEQLFFIVRGGRDLDAPHGFTGIDSAHHQGRTLG